MGGYIFTLLKKYKKQLLQKSETKLFNQKQFCKELVQGQEKKPRAFWEFNACSWHCYIMFLTGTAFSYFTFHVPLEVLSHNWSLLKAVNNALTSYIKLCKYVVLNLNKPIKVACLQYVANQ